MPDAWYELQDIKPIDVEIAQMESWRTISPKPCIPDFEKQIKSPSLKEELDTINRKTKQLEKEMERVNRKIMIMINKRKFNFEKMMFQKIKAQLLRKKEFLNEFIAIHEGEMIDHDRNNITLAKRVYKTYGYKPIYIDKVSEKREIYKIPSQKVR